MKSFNPLTVMIAPVGNTQAIAVALLLLGALFISASSLGFEHIGGYLPCALCIIQRHVHYGMIPASALTLALVWLGAPSLLIRTAFLALAAYLAYGWAVGVYQAGAEWEIWLGPNCSSTINIAPDATNLLSQLESTKLVSCTVAQLRILGLSFGGWNVVLSSGLILIALGGAFLPKDALSPLFARLPFLGTWALAIQKKA